MPNVTSLNVNGKKLPLNVDSQYLVDPCLISAAARRQAFTDEIRFLANQTDVEHGADY